MHLYKAGALRATAKGPHTGQHGAAPGPDSARQGAAARADAGCRIGVVISDDCSSSDVARVLAKTCDRFGSEQGWASRVGTISITIIAGRSGFVLRENACLPVWCEAIYDVDPLDFHYFVVPKSGSGSMEPRPEIVSWLARAGAEAKIIRLSLDADTAKDDALAQPWRPALDLEASHASDSARANRRDAWREEARNADGTGADALAPPLEKPAPSERIRATVEWINENYGARISISRMAEHALMSERNFLRRFRAEMGHTPHDYLSKIRLESACRLLVTTALPVDKIARHCGLFNGDHLRKHFVRHFGMSPVEYRSARFKALQSRSGTDSDEQ
jgi:AraC-like DNA-binding protein